jgi:GntR family transcriptional repressor for pyruvate dehydrogenase complex
MDMKGDVPRIAKPSKLTEVVAERLLDMIREGTLEPGVKLPTEKEFAESFGVGRGSVREALQSLEHVGLIESRPGIGRFLKEGAPKLLESLTWSQVLDQASTLELMEARMVLEVAVARYAAERVTDDVIQALEAIMVSMEESLSSDLDRFFECELEFHMCLARLCNNRVLSQLVNLLITQVSDQAEKFMRPLPRTCRANVEQFKRIVRHLANSDAESAGDTMREHLELMRQLLCTSKEGQMPQE